MSTKVTINEVSASMFVTCGGLSSINETKSTNMVCFISRTSRTGQVRKKENHSLGATLFDSELAKEDFREGGAYFCWCCTGNQKKEGPSNHTALQRQRVQKWQEESEHEHFQYLRKSKAARYQSFDQKLHEDGTDAVGDDDDEDEREHRK